MPKSAYGHRKLKDLMWGKMWRLAEMDDEQEAARDPSTIVHSGTDNLPAEFQNRNCDLTPSTNLRNLGSHGCGAANRLPDVTASQMQRGGSVSSSRKRIFKPNTAIDRFLEERDDSCHLESSASECSQCDNTGISKDGSWLRYLFRDSGPQQWPAIDPIKQSLSHPLKTYLRLRIRPIARLYQRKVGFRRTRFRISLSFPN